MDERLGIAGKLSAGVKRVMVKLAGHMPYADAAELYEELTRVHVGTTTIWEEVQEVGQRARPALNPITSQKDTSESIECMGIGMDGFMVNVRSEGWKEVKIGVVFEAKNAGEPAQNRHGTLAERVHACAQSCTMHLGGPEGFGTKLSAEARARKWDKAHQQVVVGDGAVWIWNLAEADYPSAAHVVDWYHAKQHLCSVADALHPNQPEAAAAWVTCHAQALYDGQALALADRLTHRAAMAEPSIKAKLDTEAGYFASNHQRMQYRDFQSALLPIGSGATESAAKQAKQRLSGPGMRWSRAGLENMLPIRAAVMSNSFDAFCRRVCP